MESAPVMSVEDKNEIRRLWVRVQDHHCAVCGTGTATKPYHGAQWLIDYNRGHGPGEPCAKGSECFDCVLGVLCRSCMLLMHNYRMSSANVPIKWVNGLDPKEWGRRAAAHIDLGVTDGGTAR